MFEVSWDDPTKETVGQRKNRKGSEQTSRSSGQPSRASTSSDSTSTKPKNRPSILTLLNSNKKTFAPQPSRPKALVPEKPPLKEVFHESISGKSRVATKESTSNLILDRYIVAEYPHPQHLSIHSTSDEPTATFTSWASHSSSSSSSSPWSSSSDLARTGISSLGEEWRRSGSSVFIQPLSPTSFVTRRTEISVETRRVGEGDRVRGAGMGLPMGMEGEVASTVVRIYADDGRKEEVRGMYARLSPSAFPSSPPLSPPLPSPSSPPSRLSIDSASDFTLHDPLPTATSPNRSQSTLRLPATTRSSSKPRLVLIDPETESPPQHVRHHKRSPAERSGSRSRSRNNHGRKKDHGLKVSPIPSVSPNSDTNGSLSPNVWKAPENWECGSGEDDKAGDGDRSESENVPPPAVPPKSAARLLRKSIVNMKNEVDTGLGVEG